MKKIVNKQLWVRQDGDQYALGLTNEGQDDFGSIAFITLPKIGAALKAGATFAELEAEKAVTELLSPLSGTVVSVNQEALSDGAVLDTKNEDFAWLIVLTDVNANEFENLV